MPNYKQTLECIKRKRKARLAHLTERCRISVRDLLMLLAILMSSFSSESVYWASWSKLRAQSDRLAFSSACTACERKKRGQGGQGSKHVSSRPKAEI